MKFGPFCDIHGDPPQYFLNNDYLITIMQSESANTRLGTAKNCQKKIYWEKIDKTGKCGIHILPLPPVLLNTKAHIDPHWDPSGLKMMLSDLLRSVRCRFHFLQHAPHRPDRRAAGAVEGSLRDVKLRHDVAI